MPAPIMVVVSSLASQQLDWAGLRPAGQPRAPVPTWRGSLNQAERQVEFLAQLLFAPGHLSIVALVIVAAQVQDAVQGENLDFFGGRVSEGSRIFGCYLR